MKNGDRGGSLAWLYAWEGVAKPVEQCELNIIDIRQGDSTFSLGRENSIGGPYQTLACLANFQGRSATKYFYPGQIFRNHNALKRM
jgi:hypothetical protein